MQKALAAACGPGAGASPSTSLRRQLGTLSDGEELPEVPSHAAAFGAALLFETGGGAGAFVGLFSGNPWWGVVPGVAMTLKKWGHYPK